MTRWQGLVAGVSGLILGVTTWGILMAATFTNAVIIALVGYALTTVGVILFAVVLEEGPHA